MDVLLLVLLALAEVEWARVPRTEDVCPNAGTPNMGAWVEVGEAGSTCLAGLDDAWCGVWLKVSEAGPAAVAAAAADAAARSFAAVALLSASMSSVLSSISLVMT